MAKRHALTIPALAALGIATAAAAATASVTINLVGGAGNRTLTACGATHHYTLYHRGTVIKINGAVTPAPAAFRVKLKVKQCIRGSFRTIWAGGAHERSDGTYTGTFLAHRRGMFFARAYAHIGAHSFKSDKQHFRIG